MKNITMAIRKQTSDNAITIPLYDLELYFVSDGRIITAEDGFAVQELREMATKDYQVVNMAELLGMGGGSPMWVVTNKSAFLGASALAYPEYFAEACEKAGAEKCYILPSSIHELIVLPVDPSFTPAELSNMIQGINSSMVSPGEQLSDHPYFYDRATNTITMA